MTPAELGKLADELDSEAAIAARPGQMDRLETIAKKLRDFAAALTTVWGVRTDGQEYPEGCSEGTAYLRQGPGVTPVSRVVGPWQDTTPNPPAQTLKETDQ